MARGPKYKVPRRRRLKGKTNYYKRYRMVLSGHPRFVVRKTNKYIWVQVVVAKPQGDHVIAAAHSQELVKLYGWKGATSNTPAAYLTGLLAAVRALKAGIKYAVPDIGLYRPTKGAKVFAAIKAANDAGLRVPMGNGVSPSEDRIKGEHISAWAELLREQNPAMYERLFSQYIARGFDPSRLPSHFEEVKKKIMEEYREVISMIGGGE